MTGADTARQDKLLRPTIARLRPQGFTRNAFLRGRPGHLGGLHRKKPTSGEVRGNHGVEITQQSNR